MDQQQNNGHCIINKYFQSNISDSFTRYRNNGVLSDISLVCEGEVIKAHKLLLAIYSPFFENVLLAQSNEYLVLADIPKVDLLLLVEYIYKGKVTVPENVLSSFLGTAKKLQIMGISDEEFHTPDDLGANVTQNSAATPNLSVLRDKIIIIQNIQLEHNARIQHSEGISETRVPDKSASNPLKTGRRFPRWLVNTKQPRPHKEEPKKGELNILENGPRNRSSGNYSVLDRPLKRNRVD